jgi:hypothetical protein
MLVKKAYRAPQLVEYGSLDELTLGSGHNSCDFAIGHTNNDTGNSGNTGTGISNSSRCSALGSS